jgi:integrase
MPRQTGIKKLENGRYQARYFAGFDSKGKRRYPSRTFDLQSDAIKWRAARVNEKSSGRHFEIHGLTVGQYLDQWLASKKQVLRENSLSAYQERLNDYVKPEIGHLKLTRLRPNHIEDMQSQLLTRVSATTAATARVVLGGALKKAVRLGLIPVNPVEGTDGPKKSKAVMYAMSVEETLRFLDSCASSRLGLYYALALSTGLRPEEGIALQWPDLEFDERGICHVKRVIHRLDGGGWRWHEPKTKSSTRSIVFPGELAGQLLEHRKRQLEQKLRAGQYWQNNDLVFTSSHGAPLWIRALEKEFKAILEQAGIPSTVRLYDLRHSFVTLSLLAGVDPKTVSQEAGHASVAFTLDHYGHVLKEMHEAASDKREQLLRGRAAGR